MYNITYRNVLKPGKNDEDFAQWQKEYWTMQKRWGAISVKFWSSNQGNNKILFCCYTVKNVFQWNQKNTQPEAETAIKALSQIVDIDQMSIHISHSSTLDDNRDRAYQ